MDTVETGPGSPVVGRSSSPADLGLDTGVFESHAGNGHAWVRRDATGEFLRADVSAYPVDFAFEPGDETGIEMVDGQWHAIPSVSHTVRLRTRVEWWTLNRFRDEYRLLAELPLDAAGRVAG